MKDCLALKDDSNEIGSNSTLSPDVLKYNLPKFSYLDCSAHFQEIVPLPSAFTSLFRVNLCVTGHISN